MLGGYQARRPRAGFETPLGQSRLHSFIEAVANVVLGFGIAILTQMAVFPLVGLRVPMDRQLLIGLAFTLVSLARSYLLRRLFVRIGRRGR